MRGRFKQLYQSLIRLYCLLFRQRLPFFAFALMVLVGIQAHAQVLCINTHAAAFESFQKRSLQQFVDRYVDPQTPYKNRPYFFGGGFSLVSDLNEATMIYEFGDGRSNRSQVSPERHIIAQSHLSQISLPQKELELQTPDGALTKYQMTDIGFSLLSKDDPLLDEAFDRARLNRKENQPFQIEYHQDYFKARRFLVMLHQWASLAVTDIYANRKGYLSLTDLYSLRAGDLSPESSDNYFVLQKNLGVPLIKQSYQEFLDSTLAIVRLVRACRNTMLVPKKYDDRVNPYQLPVVKRYLGTRIGEKLKNELYNIGVRGNKTIGEVSRLVRRTDFPGPLIDSLWKNVFEAAINPEDPIDILLISVDKSTRRLFSKYGFQDLMPLTDPDKETPEFLMYLDTSTPDFYEVLADLRKKTADLHEGNFKNSEATGLQNKYEAPAGWYRGSDEEAFRLTHARLQQLKESDRGFKYDQRLTGLMYNLVGHIRPGQKVLIISEEKEAIFEVLRTDIDQSLVTVIGLNEIGSLQERDFDFIDFSGAEYENAKPELILESIKQLASRAKKRALLRISVPPSLQSQGISYETVRQLIRSIPGTDSLGFTVGNNRYFY